MIEVAIIMQRYWLMMELIHVGRRATCLVAFHIFPIHALKFKYNTVDKGMHIILFVCFWCDSPQWTMASSFMRFLYHTQRRITVGRTSLDE